MDATLDWRRSQYFKQHIIFSNSSRVGHVATPPAPKKEADPDSALSLDPAVCPPQPCPRAFPHIVLRSPMCQVLDGSRQAVQTVRRSWSEHGFALRPCLTYTKRRQPHWQSSRFGTLQVDRTFTVPPGWTFLLPFHFITPNCKNIYLFHIYSLFFFSVQKFLNDN